MPRTPPEWVGTSDDQPIPPRIRVRVFDRHHGICHISGRRIMAGCAWQCDHIVPLIAGGEHRESNLAPALIDPHREKTKAEVAEKSRVAKRRKSFLGIKKPSRFPGSRNSPFKRKMDGTVVRRG
jgi:5-methylcytosine-specific restriction enzyme A